VNRWLRALLAAVMLAGVVHLLAVFRVPHVAPRAAYARVLAVAPPDRFSTLEDDIGEAALVGLDPFFVHAVCPFAFDDGTYSFSGPVPTSFWSMAIVADNGTIATSVSSEGDPQPFVDVTIGLEAALQQLRIEADGAGGLGTLLPVVSGSGFALIRAFAASPAERDILRFALGSLACGPRVAAPAISPTPAAPAAESP
jgi:uncharacterized membrane protein